MYSYVYVICKNKSTQKIAELAWRICACVQKYSNTYVQKYFNKYFNTHTHTHANPSGAGTRKP